MGNMIRTTDGISLERKSDIGSDRNNNIGTERKIGGISIRSMVSHSGIELLSATDLYKVCDKAMLLGSSKTHKYCLFRSIDIEEVYMVLKASGSVDMELKDFMCLGNSLPYILNGLGVYKTVGGGKNRSVYVSVSLFVLLASYMNKVIYERVKDWVDNYLTQTIDSMAQDRLRAFDKANPLLDMAHGLEGISVLQLIQGLNMVMFNKTEGFGSIDKDKRVEMIKLQEGLIFCIERGYIKDWEGLRNILKELHNENWGNVE